MRRSIFEALSQYLQILLYPEASYPLLQMDIFTFVSCQIEETLQIKSTLHASHIICKQLISVAKWSLDWQTHWFKTVFIKILMKKLKNSFHKDFDEEINENSKINRA